MQCARRNNSRLGSRVNSACRCVLRSGRTLGRPSKPMVLQRRMVRKCAVPFPRFPLSS
jgi:hypothetical protein